MMDKFDKYIMNKKRDDYFRLKAKVIAIKRNKENKMGMKVPSKKQVLKASERCKEVEEVMRDLFPQAFEEEWEDVTLEVAGLRNRTECGSAGEIGVVFKGENHFMPYNVKFVDTWKGERKDGNPMTVDFIYKRKGKKIFRKRRIIWT